MSSAFLKRPSMPLLTTVQLSSVQGWTSTFQFLSLCWITRKFSLFLFKDFSITHLIISPSSCRKYLRFRGLEFAHLEEGNWHISCSVFTLPKSLSPGTGSFPLPSPALWISQMHLWNRGYFCAVRRNLTVSWQLCTKTAPQFQALVSTGGHSSPSS